MICSVCSQNTEQWACPQCHSHIPKNIQQTPSRTFVIIGDTKKAFEESLIFRLQEGLGLDLGIQIKETEAGPCPEHPSLYEIATSNPDQKPLSVSFLKLSEKEFLDKTKRKRYGKLLSKASGIICLIDPEGLPGFSENGKTTALPVEKLAEGIQNLVKASLFRMSMPPVAFALSSLEKLAPLLPSTNLLLHPSQYRGGYNEEDGKSLSREVMGHIGTWAGPRVLRLLESLFPKYRFFCYSLNYEGYSLRVEDAFLWHLTKLDILQVKSRPETYDGPKLVVNENVRSQ
ncbi:MAG: hypothetical protein HOI80_05935 [Alphaproteobacteria bacterium]|nr:hypothetical protein [Alphaproteobacteria bacterium]MBT5390086.1 hypothetical protein [Alphaproteobacteria bacterium]MBT5540545.1 hypothetical protein [Alphaproteobacteria bacterium]MBT5655016.1 hypothetical protein [Alphaproteobacteria bacterium]